MTDARMFLFFFYRYCMRKKTYKRGKKSQGRSRRRSRRSRKSRKSSIRRRSNYNGGAHPLETNLTRDERARHAAQDRIRASQVNLNDRMQIMAIEEAQEIRARDIQDAENTQITNAQNAQMVEDRMTNTQRLQAIRRQTTVDAQILETQNRNNNAERVQMDIDQRRIARRQNTNAAPRGRIRMAD